MLRAIDRKHDYVRLNLLYDKVMSAIINCDRKKFESAEAYANAWVDYMAAIEGYNELHKWYNRVLAWLTGATGYHLRFLESLNFKIETIGEALKDKDEELANMPSKIGFSINKK